MTSTSPFNPAWQMRQDGELSNAMKRRIEALLASSPRVSLALIARAVGISPSFMAALMRDKAIRTRHMAGFDAAIQRLEAQAGFSGTTGTAPATAKLIDLITEVAATLSATDRADLTRRIAAIP